MRYSEVVVKALSSSSLERPLTRRVSFRRRTVGAAGANGRLDRRILSIIKAVVVCDRSGIGNIVWASETCQVIRSRGS